MKKLLTLDGFGKNILIVFAGTTLLNVFNLLYQLIIAHKLPVTEFAAFNSLIAIFMIAAAPLNTLQLAVTKYVSEFRARQETERLKAWLSGLIRKNIVLSLVTFVLFTVGSLSLLRALKISHRASGYMLAFLLASSWFLPVYSGAVQGLELFGWFSAVSVAGGILKLLLAAVFIGFGYSAAGALGALFAANIFTVILLSVPLGRFVNLSSKGGFRYRDILHYLFPVGLAYLCFMTLVSSDMVLVRYFFDQQDSGYYSLAQIIGKIFLFLPGAVSMVMFPRASSLNARQQDTRVILNRSMSYVVLLCLLAAAAYNFFPSFIFRVLAGKVYPESILLGRFFVISMSLYTLVYLLISYFLSIKDIRFVRVVLVSTFIQITALCLFHRSLIHVQLIMCANGVVLFTVLQALLRRPDRAGERTDERH